MTRRQVRRMVRHESIVTAPDRRGARYGGRYLAAVEVSASRMNVLNALRYE